MASDDQVTSGADGRATCKAMRADRYRLWISGPDGPIAYEVLKLERDGGPDEIRIAAPLERK
jgi:hypothetical protein